MGGNIMHNFLRIAFALCASLYFTAGVSHAADLGPESREPALVEPKEPVRAWSLEVGARYWFSTGETSYDLFDSTGSLLVSRLTYDDLTGHSGEAFFRGDHSSGFFVKGYVGGGVINSGKLIDEDFEPVTVPFSQTKSGQDDGSLSYASADIGYTFYDSTARSLSLKDDPVGSPGVKLGAFVGFHYLNEELNAFGCTQLAANPEICSPGQVGAGTNVISEDADWLSLRLGLAAEFYLTERLKLSAEAAYVRTHLDAEDNHHLRPEFSGPIPQDGDGDGVQLEAVLSYQVTDAFNLGVGARYWRMEVDDGRMRFDQVTAGGVPQVLDFETERYGVFVQGSYKF
jgi:hypothetical protein